MGILDRIAPLSKEDGKNLFAKLDQILANQRLMMPIVDDIRAYVGRIENGLNDISGDIQKLKDLLANVELPQEAKDLLEAVAQKAETLANENV